MARSNKQIALDYLAAFYRGDIEAAISEMTENIDYLVYAPVEILPHLGHHVGHASVQSMLQMIQHRYPEVRYEIRSAIAQDDDVAINLQVMFRKNDRDRVVLLEIAEFFRFRDGKIASIRHFLDSFDLVQQAIEVDLTALLVGK